MAPGSKRSGGIFFLLALIIVLILVAIVVVIRFLPSILPFGIPGLTSKPQVVVSTPVPTPQSVEIIILAQPVTRGGAVDVGMLTSAYIPVTQYTQGLFYATDPNQTDLAKKYEAVLGKRAKFEMDPGTPLTQALLVDNRLGSVPSFDIPAGMVAVSIPVTRLTAVAYALQAGDHVNIIASLLLSDIDQSFQSVLPNKSAPVTMPGATAENGPVAGSITIGPATNDQGRTEVDPVLNQPIYLVPSEAQRARLVSQTLVQDAIVLWVGDFTVEGYSAGTSGQPVQPTPTPAPGEAAPPPAAPVKPDIVTLVVTPQDAVTLNNLMLTGPAAKLSLVLRSAGDSSKNPTSAVTLQFILDQYSIPVPAKLPYGTEPRFPPEGLSYPQLENGR
jgi:Flp pilus assembly protein CpaB